MKVASHNQFVLIKKNDNEWMAYSFKDTALSLRVSVIHLIALDNI